MDVFRLWRTTGTEILLFLHNTAQQHWKVINYITKLQRRQQLLSLSERKNVWWWTNDGVHSLWSNFENKVLHDLTQYHEIFCESLLIYSYSQNKFYLHISKTDSFLCLIMGQFKWNWLQISIICRCESDDHFLGCFFICFQSFMRYFANSHSWQKLLSKF